MTFEEVNQQLSPQGPITSIMTPEERRFLWETVKATPNCVVVEVGSAFGGTTSLLAAAGAAKVISVDNWQCGQRLEFEKTIKHFGVEKVVVPTQGDSTAKASMFIDESFDLVIVDADHEGDHPIKDILAWCSKPKVGGIFFVDDCANGHPSVADAIARWATQETRYEYVGSFVEVAPNGHRDTKGMAWKRIA